MPIRRLVIVACAVCFPFLSAFGTQVIFKGDGSCREFIITWNGYLTPPDAMETSNDILMQMQTWLLGFYSAANVYGNFYRGETARIARVMHLYTYVRDYCKNYPEHTLVDAMDAIMHELPEASPDDRPGEASI